MRLKLANIDEYGHLKQLSYSFTAHSLNVVYGLNEAGKSTLFHFIETMLFGFSRKKIEVEHYSPANLSQYGGSIIVELPSQKSIKITRYFKQHKGQPLVTSLINNDEQLEWADEQLISQDELERLYIHPLNRTIFRDLCALTLDELQATSMKEDDQLNQHLYHATWESSKIISQLEKRSNDTLALLYRPRGSKQQINTIVSELKQAKEKRLAMENELEAYQAIQHRLNTILQEEEQLATQKKELEAMLYIFSKAEQDFALRSEWQNLSFEYEQLRHLAIDDEQLLADIHMYLRQLEQHQHYIDELNDNMQKLMLDFNVCQASFDPVLYENEKKIMDQLLYMDPLIEDIEAKQEQLNKQALFIKQKCAIGTLILDEDVVLAQTWSKEEITWLIDMADVQKQAQQKQQLLEHQLNETKQRLHYTEEQHEWLTDSLTTLHAQQKEQPYTFIPQQLDDVIRLEASYEDAYKRTVQSRAPEGATSASYRHRSSAAKKAKGTSIVPQLFTFVLAIIISAALLMSQFTVVNLVLSAIFLTAASINTYLTITKRRLSHEANAKGILQENADENEFFAVLSQLIAIATPYNSVHYWTDAHYYQFRQAVLLYKQYLKQAEQQKATIKALEHEKFELSHQLRKLTEEYKQQEEQLASLQASWRELLVKKELPSSILLSDFKSFVLELNAIQDNIATLHAMSERLERDKQRRDEFFQQTSELAKALNISVADKHHLMLEAIKMKFEQDDKQAKLLQELRLRIEHIQAQLNSLKQPLLAQEANIREHYVLAKESSVEKWRMWLDAQQQLKQLDAAMFQLDQKRRAVLSDAQFDLLETRYSQQSLEQIMSEAAVLKQHILEVKQQEIQLVEERGQLLERLNNLSSTTERQMLDQQLIMLEERLTEALQQYTKFALMEHLVSSTRQQFEAEHQPALMQQASHYIAQLTAGKYVKIVLQPESEAFILVTEQLTQLPISRLSRGTAELVYFSLRMALLTTHQSLQHAPLILDDPFVNFDAARRQNVLQFIHQLAIQRQIILLTCHTHILEASEQQGQIHKIQL